MKDFTIAGLVYVTSWCLGRALADWTGWDAFTFGWIACGVAVFLRIDGPKFLRNPNFRRAHTS